MLATRSIVILAALMVSHALLMVPSAHAINIEFSNFTSGDSFPNSSLPQTIVADGHDVELTKYNGSSGANATILDFFQIGVEPNALFLAADIRAEVLLSAPATGGFFAFLDQGGQNYLEINGALMDFTDTALTGNDVHVVGGVSVQSSPFGALGARTAQLDGPITSLAFIGQELLIDRIELVPEPASWIMLVLGGATLFALRVRRPVSPQGGTLR